MRILLLWAVSWNGQVCDCLICAFRCQRPSQITCYTAPFFKYHLSFEIIQIGSPLHGLVEEFCNFHCLLIYRRNSNSKLWIELLYPKLISESELIKSNQDWDNWLSIKKYLTFLKKPERFLKVRAVDVVRLVINIKFSMILFPSHTAVPLQHLH